MNKVRLASMPQHAIAYDLETHLIQPGLLTPPIVLGSAAELVDGQLKGALLDKVMCRALFRRILDDPKAIVCVANGCYDFLVEAADFAKRGEDILPDIFAMYDVNESIIRGYCDGRVFEVQLTEGLHAIAQGHHGKHSLSGQQIDGRYSLKTVTFEVTGRDDAKVNDKFRSSYAQFDGWRLEDLPYEAAKYPVDDSLNTAEDALAQAGHMPSANVHVWRTVGQEQVCTGCGETLTFAGPPPACMIKRPRRNLHDLSRQAYFAWAAHLGSAWGFNVNQDMVDKLEAKYTASRDADQVPFRAAGIIREDGTENQSVLKKLVAYAYGAIDNCPTCNASGKVPSPKTEGRTKINCGGCDGTGLALPNTVPRSDKGGISKDRDTLQESADELLMAYGEQEGKKILSTYIPLLRGGRACECCGGTGADTKRKKGHEEWCTRTSDTFRKIPLIVRVNPLVETGRASIEGGLHGLPRKGGVRECIEARKGYLLSSEDYTAGELVTLAWTCIKTVGYSKMADALNNDLDAHLALAGTMLGKSYEVMKALKKAKDRTVDGNRQAAKKANFGYGGGMAELTFVLRNRADPDLFTPCENGPDEDRGVRGYNGMRPCILMDGADRCGIRKVTEYHDKPCSPVCLRCVEAAKRLREFWFQQWPEMRGYFAHIKKLIEEPGPSGTAEITHMVTGRIRGGVGFCDGANGLFQGLLADAAKDAFCAIQRECCDRTVRVESSEHMTSLFAGGPSPLYGSRAIMLAHDETIAEHPESVAHEGATRISELMVESLRFKCPELSKAVKAQPTLIRRLYKAAEPVYVNGRLVPWEPS